MIDDITKPVVDEVEQEKKDNERFYELSRKADLTDDEKKEKQELQESYGSRVKRKIDTLTSKTYEERKAREAAEQKAKELEERLKALEQEKEKKTSMPSPTLQVVTVAGKQFYTDAALRQMIDSGQISEADAVAHKDERLQEIAAERAYTRMKEEQKHVYEKEKVEGEQKIRMEDAQVVLKDHPTFDRNHPDFNPNDPVYKLSTEIWQEAYHANPRGLSLAVKRAKEILRVNDIRPDVSDEHTVLRSTSSHEPQRGREKAPTLTDEEKGIAYRMYRDTMNPRTGKNYTQSEAEQKALQAKKDRG
jgi:hypothetical protein